MGIFKDIGKLNTVRGWLALAILTFVTIEATYAAVGYGTQQPILFSLIGGTIFALTARAPYYALIVYCVALYVRTWLWAPEMGEVDLALGSLAMTLSAAIPNVATALLFHRNRKNAIIDSAAQIGRLYGLVLALYLLSSLPLYYFFRGELENVFWAYRWFVDCVGSSTSVLLVGMFVTYMITGQEYVVVPSRIPRYLSSLSLVLLPAAIWFFAGENPFLTRFSLFLSVPAILYLASNFALIWVLLGLILHSVCLAVATLFGSGPFAGGDPFTTAVSVQAYLVLVVLSAWVVALQRKAQKVSMNAMEAMNDHLEDLVSARTDELQRANASLKREVELRNQAEQLLRQIALTDPVTELPNRQGLRESLPAVRRRLENGCIILISLENLGEILENEGFEMVDSVIRIIAARIERLAGRDSILARWDDSSFALIADIKTSPFDAAAEELLAGISQKLNDPVALGTDSVAVQALCAAVPIEVLKPDDTDPLADFFLTAIAEIQNLRKSSSGSYSIARSGPSPNTGAGYRMFQQIKAGLSRKEFQVYYQPIITRDLQALLGCEALIRWNSNGHVMGPESFIAIAERSDLIVDIGYQVIRDVAFQAAQWQEQGLDLSVYSINTSVRQLAEPDFARRCLQMWESSGLSLSRLKVEITESILALDNPRIRVNLEELRQAGVSIAFDDFGTGFSSLSYLDRFPVDSIKIDRVFVQKLSAGPNSKAVIEAMGLIAQQLQLDVIVEGVESPENIQSIEALTPVRGWQGYLFSRPIPADEFYAYARSFQPQMVPR